MGRKVSQEDQDVAKRHLKKLLKKGTTVYTVLRHVSKSGMQRRIDVYVIRKNEPHFISGYVGNLLGYNFKGYNSGLVVNGGGMDMGFHLVHSLSHALFKQSYALKHHWI